MRHLTSVILGPVLGFVAYVLFGFAVGRTSVEEGWTGDNAIGVLALVGAGVAYAILVVPRLSPIGPALAGIGYLLLGLWVISDVSSFVDTMPADILTLDNAGFGPGALLVALAIPLLATLVSPNRWRSGPARPNQPGFNQPGHPGFNQPGQPGHPGFGQPSQPDQFTQPGALDPPPFGGQPSYPGSPPIGAPYSGPPSFGPPPGSPVAPSGHDPYGTPPGGNPQDPLRPDITRRIQ